MHRSTGAPRLVQYADEMPGVPLQDVWDDIPPALGSETLGYPTQKPLSLLERVVNSSSNEGDVILDPFCGCGTTIAAAEKLKRRWMGIDITHLAITLIVSRMREMYPELKSTYTVNPPMLGVQERLLNSIDMTFRTGRLASSAQGPLLKIAVVNLREALTGESTGLSHSLGQTLRRPIAALFR